MSGVGCPAYEQHDDIPSMSAGLVHSLKFAFDAQPMLLVVSFLLTIGGLIPEALGALWLGSCCTASATATTQQTLRAAIGLALTGGTGWLLRTVGSRFTVAIFSDRIALAVETHVARLQARRVDHRAPRAARLPRPSSDPARPLVPAEPRLPVAHAIRRLGGAAGHHRRPV